MKKEILILIIFPFVLFGLFFSNSIQGLVNPAAKYCKELGYEYSDGKCILPDGKKVIAWDFLLGKVGKQYSYCARSGYQIKTIHDPERCIKFGIEECAVCVLPDKTEEEVTELMGLVLTPGKCGDGKCVLGENYKSCPQDCPSGGRDGYCDGEKDGICDEDCLYQGISEKDPDCPICGNDICESDRGENYKNCPQDCVSPEVKVEIEKKREEAKKRIQYMLGGVVLLILIGVGIYFYLRRRK